ncbi:STAS domain-containing protein [Jatrophihabitans sp.]|uniref:STAS domain-containing protein n=1 Tax=Jatrophihabitans sp. TaxID=1932789 RepID=UPI0030C7629E|nr:hypothetical protein [Jatrophihabitans sp.]
MCQRDEKDAFLRPVFLVRADRSSRTLRVFGELDICSAPELLRAARDELPSWMRVAVCLESLTFVDAAGLRALETLREIHRSAGGALTVLHATPRIARIFVLGGLADLLRDPSVWPAAGTTTAPTEPPGRWVSTAQSGGASTPPSPGRALVRVATAG